MAAADDAAPDSAHDAEHEHFMRLALQQAELAFSAGEVPVGAIMVQDGRVIAAEHNERVSRNDPTAHAELIVIAKAATVLGDWRLERCSLYVTLEPCPMCAGAVLQARIPRLAFGAADPKAGAVQSLYQLLSDVRLNHQVQVVGGVSAAACGEILTRFFRQQRALGKK